MLAWVRHDSKLPPGQPQYYPHVISLQLYQVNLTTFTAQVPSDVTIQEHGQ